MRAFAPLALLFVSWASFAGNEDPILVTLNELKTHYRKREIGEAANALKKLNELAAAPELVEARERLLPALTFYTAVIRFELRDEAGSREAVERYLRLQ